MASGSNTSPCNIDGVGYDHKFVESLESSGRAMTAVLDLDDTAQLWDLYFQDTDVRRVLEQYFGVRRCGYAAGLTGNTSMKNNMLSWVGNTSVLQVMKSPTVPALGVVKNDMYAAVVTLWFVRQLMLARPVLFPGSRVAQDQYSSYDLLHGWKLLAFFWKQVSGNKVPKKARGAKPAPIIWHVAPTGGADGPGATAEDDGQPTPLDAEEIFGETDDELTALLEKNTDDVMRAEDVVLREEEVSRAARQALSQKVGDVRNRRPMTAGEIECLYQHAMGSDRFEATGIIRERVNTNISEIVTEDESGSASGYHGDLGKEAAGLGQNLDIVRQGAEAPDYESACQSLGLDPLHPILSAGGEGLRTQTELKPWQVTGVRWLLDQEASAVAGGILADNCGLGKTLTALAAVYLDSLDETKQRHRPTLVLCPSTLIDSWLCEIEKWFGTALHVYLFHGLKEHTSSVLRKMYTVNTLNQLQQELAALSPHDETTSRTIVLSSYSTWAGRTTMEACGRSDDDNDNDENHAAITRLANLQRRDADTNLTEMDDDEGRDFDQERTSTQRRKARAKKETAEAKWESRIKGYFGRVVCDEGHALKTIATRDHQSVALLNVRNAWFLTATPLHNCAFDLCGYLAILYSGNVQAAVGEDGRGGDQDPRPDPPPYHLLEPRFFAKLFSNGHLSPHDGYHALPVILPMIALCREIGQWVDPSKKSKGVIGEDIPPIRIMTVNLKYPKRLQTVHNARFTGLCAQMEQRQQNQSTNPTLGTAEASGYLDWKIIRLLNHLAFSPRLDTFFRAVDHKETLAPEVAKQMARPDRGFQYFWKRTTCDSANLPPCNALGQAKYLLTDAPKLRYLLRIFWRAGVWSKDQSPAPRFLLFVQSPVVMWLVQMFLDALDVSFVTIGVGMGHGARAAAAADFSNARSSTRILLTSFDCGSHGLNLHHQCANAVLLEPPADQHTLFRAVGSVRRLGQEQLQHIWILFQDESISRYMGASIPQVTAQTAHADAAETTAPGDDDEASRAAESGTESFVTAEDVADLSERASANVAQIESQRSSEACKKRKRSGEGE